MCMISGGVYKILISLICQAMEEKLEFIWTHTTNDNHFCV